VEVWRDASLAGGPEPVEADAVLGLEPGLNVGIVTADCVPILAAADDGSRVVAIHAGWRGLAAGVIEAAMAALQEAAGRRVLVAAIGPAARGCCYEVDEPVRVALSKQYRSQLDGEVLQEGQPGHFQLDLPLLAERILIGCGVERTRLGTLHRVCTICSPERFESYRRDGEAAGRLRHFIAGIAGPPTEG
jgi:YfiH family protein